MAIDCYRIFDDRSYSLLLRPVIKPVTMTGPVIVTDYMTRENNWLNDL